MRIGYVFSRPALSVMAAAIALSSYAAAEPAVPVPVPAAATSAADPEKSAPSAAGAASQPAAPAALASTPISTATTVDPPAPPKVPLTPAKILFSAVKGPSPNTARAIGGYAKGCVSGAQALPTDGAAWQVMRLSRNRNWGHPKLVSMVEHLAADAKAKDGWSGLLVGDLSQPRGGPMLTGHASHQIGLDVDIWLTPMPDHVLSRQERETLEAASVLSEDGLAVKRELWTDAHTKLIKRAASYPEVERVLVHPAIKQVLCYAAGDDRRWLDKVRPYWGHDEHIHVRIGCPAGSGDCKSQPPPPGDDGCGKEVDDWIKLLANIKPEPEAIPVPPSVEAKPIDKPKVKPQLTLLDLPPVCRAVLAYDNATAAKDIAAAVKAEKGPEKPDPAKAKPALTASVSKLGGPKVKDAKEEKAANHEKNR